MSCNVHGNKKNAQSNHKIIRSKGIAQEETHLPQKGVGLFREKEKHDTQHQDQDQRNQRDHPVNFFPFSIYWHFHLLSIPPSCFRHNSSFS